MGRRAGPGSPASAGAFSVPCPENTPTDTPGGAGHGSAGAFSVPCPENTPTDACGRGFARNSGGVR
jgi:hypothetical protein